MKELKRDLQSVLKSLRVLTQKTGKMIRQLEKLDKAQHVVFLLIPGLVLPDFFIVPIMALTEKGFEGRI